MEQNHSGEEGPSSEGQQKLIGNDKDNQDNDPFDPSRLRVSQDFAKTLGVRKLLTTVPVRKPNRQEFIRVHPGEDYRLETVILELKEDRESYLIERKAIIEENTEVRR